MCHKQELIRLDRPCRLCIALLPQTLTLQAWAQFMASAPTKGHEEMGRIPCKVIRQPLCPPSAHPSSSEGPVIPVGMYRHSHGISPFSFRYCKEFPHQNCMAACTATKNSCREKKKIRGVWIHICDTLKMREKYMGHRI